MLCASEVMSFFDPEILVDLECPVCLEYMHPPIRQCQTGHSMCDRCFSRVWTCPICRAPRSYTRSLALETLQARIVFPCKNRSEGCRFIDLGPYITEHEGFCQYGSFPCLLKNVTRCEWNGPITGFLGHSKLSHAEHVFLNEDNTVVCRDFVKENVECPTHVFNAIFESDNQAFKCVLHINYDTGLMLWSVFYVGLERSPRDYTYEVQIENYNSHEKHSFKSTCKHYKQEYNVFNKNLCMITNYHIMKKFCNGNDFTYKVKVIKNFFSRN